MTQFHFFLRFFYLMELSDWIFLGGETSPYALCSGVSVSQVFLCTVSLVRVYRDNFCFHNWSIYTCVNGCSALHKKFLVLCFRRASELSAATSIFLCEVTVWTVSILKNTWRLQGCHHQFLWCCCLWREIITAVVLGGKNQTQRRKRSSGTLTLIIRAGICLVWVECASSSTVWDVWFSYWLQICLWRRILN